VSSYDELLVKAKVPSLKIRRMRTMSIECFKILSKLSPTCLHDLVVLKDCKYNFRYSNIIEIPRVRTTTYGKNSFKYIAAVLWNDLPDDFRKISNFKVRPKKKICVFTAPDPPYFSAADPNIFYRQLFDTNFC
jgi:hypothetical protein